MKIFATANLCASAPLRPCVNVSRKPIPARNLPSPFRGIRKLLFLILLLAAFPLAAHAQWATSRVEHNWCVTINGNAYGLEQQFASTYSLTEGWRTTTICFGRHKLTTSLPAAWVATLALAPVAVIVLFLVFTSRRGSPTTPPEPLQPV